jgi:hypothetical protein
MRRIAAERKINKAKSFIDAIKVFKAALISERDTEQRKDGRKGAVGKEK